MGEIFLKEVRPGGQGSPLSFSDTLKINQGNRNAREIGTNRRNMAFNASEQQGNWGFSKIM